MKKVLSGLTALVLVALSACGGGGDEGAPVTAPSTPATPQSVGGFWSINAFTPTGVGVQGRVLVTEDGRFFGTSLNLSNNCVVLTYGSLSTAGNTFSGTAASEIAQFSVGAALPACTLADGSTSARSVLSGSFVQRTSLSITATATTSSGMPLGTDTQTLQFDPLYNLPSSLAAVAGAWTGPTGNVVSINAGGQLSVTDVASGCVLNSQISIIDPSYNAYSAAGSISRCTGPSVLLNGGSVRALMMIDNTVAPNRLVVGQETSLLNGTRLVSFSTNTR